MALKCSRVAYPLIVEMPQRLSVLQTAGLFGWMIVRKNH
uniref:Uncharacterized protein n=1 Tax=Rhizophora mucronata TaxID=61149 RepID=A0A2P2P6Q1_RHIMU